MATKIAQLLTEMENWDKDKRFMAASDLCAELTSQGGLGGVDAHVQKRVCHAFLKQIEDASIDVQGNAVKCLGKIVPHFQDQQIGEVVAKLSQLVLDGSAEVRDIYATCLKGLFAELPHASAPLVYGSVFPKMQQGICGHAAPEVKEQCCDVLQDLLKRFGEPRTRIDDDTVAAALRGLLSHEYKPSLRKRAIGCIGVVASSSTDRQLDTLVRAVLQRVRERAGKESERQTSIQCLGTVSRFVGSRMPHLDTVVPLLLQICQQATEDVSMDDAQRDAKHEVVENALNALESFVLRCSKDMGQHTPPLVTLLQGVLAYDPNYYAAGDDEGMDEEDFEEFDDEGIDSEDDDNSWKVRRAGLKVLSALVAAQPDQLPTLYGTFVPLVVDRLKAEREDSVRLGVFATCGDMVRAVTGSLKRKQLGPASLERASSQTSVQAIVAVLPKAVDALHKQLGKNLQTRQGALQLLTAFAQAMPAEVEPCTLKLLPELLKALKDTNSQVRLEALTFLQALANAFVDASVYQQLAPKVVDVLKNELMCNAYYKLAAQSFRVFGALIAAFRPDPSVPADQALQAFNYVVVVEPVLEVLCTRLTATEIDQDVKEAALDAFGRVCARLGDTPQLQPALTKCLEPFCERFRNEVTRTTAIKALKTMCASPVVSPVGQCLPRVVAQLTSFLAQQSRPLRQLTLDTLVHVEQKHGAQLELSAHVAALAAVAALISDGDLFLTDLGLQVCVAALAARPESAQAIAQHVYPKALGVCKSPLLQGGALETLLTLLGQLALAKALDNAAVFKDLADAGPNPTRHIVLNVSRALARVVVNSPDQFRQSAVQQLLQPLKDSSCTTPLPEQAILTLGEMGKFWDLSAVPDIGPTFLTQLHSGQSEEVRTAAALALGYAAVGGRQVFLQLILTEIGRAEPSSKTRYLLLTSLRELITLSTGEGAASAEDLLPFLSTVLPLLQQCADAEEEGVRNIVSECFGSLLLLAPEQVTQAQLPLLAAAASAKAKAAGVAALRYASKAGAATDVLTPFKDPLLACLGDEAHLVRKAAVQALPALCGSLAGAELLRPHAASILQQVEANCQQDKQLVREVDLGPFKHKVDDGLPLRKFAYAAVSGLMLAFPSLCTPAVVDLVLLALSDHEDVQAAACGVLVELVKTRPPAVLSRLQDLVEPFDRAVQKHVKQIAQKQQVPKAEDTLRLYARTLIAVQAAATDPQTAQPLNDMLAHWQHDPVFSQALAAVTRES